MGPGPDAGAYFAHQESLRCKLLRSKVRKEVSGQEDGSDAPPPVLVPSDHLETPSTPEIAPLANRHKAHGSQPIQQAAPSKRIREGPPHAWRYPPDAWRSHPTVKEYSDEPILFIPASSLPTDADAAVPLSNWLRMPAKLCAPPETNLLSGVIRVDGVGWVIRIGYCAGVIERMVVLLERKAGKQFSFKSKMHTIEMETALPLEVLD